MAIMKPTQSDSRTGGYVDHPSFHDPFQRRIILALETGSESVVGGEPPNGGRAQGEGTSLSGVRFLDVDEERQLFLRMNCLKFLGRSRLGNVVQSTGHAASRCGDSTTKSLEGAAQRIRDRIATTHLGLVGMIASGFSRCGVSRDDLIGVGNLTLLKAIDHFDVRLGFRFSTYAGTAIRREMVRVIRRHMQHDQRVRLVLDRDLESPAAPEETFDREQLGMVKEILASMPPREREILKCRYGWNGATKTLSYRKLAGQWGISPERVRQLVERSLARARRKYGRKLGLSL